MNPLQLFGNCYSEELKLSKARIPSACCLSTTGLDGYPNARFVSLKEITDEALIVTGPLNSRKGLEIKHSNKVSLTFWWTETERQIRVQGEATQIAGQLADRYFSEREIDSQLVSLLSEQGKEMDSLEGLIKKYQEAETAFAHKVVPRPDNWGGYSVKPVRMEFMEFKASRFHERKLYELKNNNWELKLLQP